VQVAADLAGYGTTLLEYSRERISDEGREADIQKGKAPGQVRPLAHGSAYLQQCMRFNTVLQTGTRS